MQNQIKRVVVNGAELNYIEQGEGDPVIFVHGTLDDYRTWGQQIEPFSKHYHVIAYSRRYHYPNVWISDGKDYSATLHARDLAELIKELGFESAHIVGHSYGAYVSLILACEHPEMVRSLVLCEPPLFAWLLNIPGGDILLADFIADAWEPARQAFEQGETEQAVKLVANGILGKGFFDKLPQEVRSGAMDNARELRAETQSSDYVPLFSCRDVQTIKVPTLLVKGEFSSKFLHLIIDRLEQCLPYSESTIIPDAIHLMNNMNPQVFNDTVLSFLTRH
jgi:pimeloyl-ACP methyl ester carboxylesterase